MNSDGPWEWFGISNLKIETEAPGLGFEEDLFFMADNSNDW